MPLWENLNSDNRLFQILNKTRDEHLIVSGVKDVSSIQVASIIAKFDTAGNLIWQRPGRNMYVGEHDFKSTPDGRYLFAGNVRTNQPSNARDTYLQEFDENGDTTWAQTFIEPSADYPTEMLFAENGEVLIAGLQLSPHYLTLRRTDSLGNTIWYKKYTTNDNMSGTRMIRNRNNNLVLLSSVIVPGVYPFHSYLMEVDQNGDSLRSKLLIIQDSVGWEATNRIFNNIIQTSDGGYAFGGRFTNNGFIAKTDSAFNLLWYYEMPPQQAPTQLHQTFKLIELQDSTLLFLSKDNDPVSDAFYINRLTKDGDSISTTAIQSQVCPNGNMQPYNWQFLADSSIVICGWCVSNNQAYIGRWGNLNYPLPMGFFADTTDTTTVSAPQALLQQPQVKLYPNPAKGQVRVQLFGTTAESTLQLYSVTGRKVLEGPISGVSENIQMQSLPQGLYLYRVLVNEQVLSGKLVLE